MKNVFLEAKAFVLHIYYCYLLEKQIFKSSKWGCLQDVVAGRLRGANDGTFWGSLRDVGHTCFLNSSQKHFKLTFTSYSRLYSE